MDGPVFDAMLKNALEEALRQDIEESPAPPPPSRRQRRRMRRLLAAPRSAGEWLLGNETKRRPRNPARWLAAVVVAALLTGAAAAGLALGGGERFRQMFEKDTWAADYYGNAVDTEQLLDLGAGMDTALLESGGLRFEMLDAVFDGQTALLELRVTVLDPELLERLREDDGTAMFMKTEVCSEEGEDVGSIGLSCRSWKNEGSDLEEGQYSLLCSFSGESLGLGGRYSLRLEDFTLFPQETGSGDVLREGPWTLSVSLRPTEVLRLEPNAVCQVKGIDWILDGVTLSPLALGLSFHREDDGRYSDWFGWAYKDLSIRLKSGEVLELKGSTGVGSSNTQMNMQVEFLMPLDLEQVEALCIYGMEIPLRE